jgi:hypothetical protein
MAPAATQTVPPAAAVAANNKGGILSKWFGHKTETPAAAKTAPAAPTAPRAPAAASVPPKPAAPPQPAPAFTGLEYVAQAPVGLEDARRNAHKAHPGPITNSVLGPDKQGKLRYVFTIGGTLVYVDAQNGNILASDP